MKRIPTALALAAFAIYSVFFAPQWLFVAIVIGMAAVCYYEYAGIAHASGVDGPMWLGYAGGVVALLQPMLLPLVVVVLLPFTLRCEDPKRALLFAGALALGLVYVFVAWGWAIPLRSASPYWILFALAINWVGDIAAYYVGRAIGRNKLAPRISPGKSWEGTIASCVAAIGFGVWFGQQFGLGVPLVQMMLLSLAANIAGQVGDLFESALKRGAGVKDSSTLLPGHGGFLDRLDSTLFSMPVVYYFLVYRSTLG